MITLATYARPDTGLLGSGTSGLPYHDCSRAMRAPPGSTFKIPVCLAGDGMYSREAIQEIIAKDWFTGNEFTAGQIEEVRFVCEYRPFGILFSEAKVYFPNQAESLAGRRMRIDIPCGLSPKAAAQEFKKSIELIKRSLTRPADVVRDTKQVSVACDKNSTSPQCKEWKSYLSSVLSGEAVNRVVSTMTYCQTGFTVGLAESTPVTGESSTRSSVEFELSNIPVDGVSTWVENQMSHCAFPMKNYDGFNFAQCLEQSKRLRNLLAKQVRIYDAHAIVNGRKIYCKMPNDEFSGSRVEQVIYFLLCNEQGSAYQEIRREIEDHSLDIEAIRVTPSEMEDVASRMGVRKDDLSIVKDRGYQTPVEADRIQRVGCGLDLECVKRLAILERSFQKTPEGKYPPGCYRYIGFKGSSVADISMEFEPAEGCPPSSPGPSPSP